MNKTPEEILKDKFMSEEIIEVSSKQGDFYITLDEEQADFCTKIAMEYGKQQYNQAIKDSTQEIIKFYGERGLTNTGNRIKEEILKLLKP